MRLIIISLFLFLSICHAEQLKKAEVVKISDGDTIWVRIDGRKVKLNLAGIDTPEEFKSRKLRKDSARCDIAQKYIRRLGRIATRYARSILHRRDKVRIKVYKRDRKEIYGLLYLPDGTCYNEKMVEEGYACVTDNIEEKELAKLKALLERAKKKKKGLWQKYYKHMDCLCR